MTRFAASLTLLLLLVSPASAKDPKVKPPHPKEVHAAITRGIAWLEARFDKGFPKDSWHSPVELTALTYIHARADRKSKVFQAALKEMETCKLQHTYRVATLAMTLSEINPFLYRARLAHCAQWLADTQCPGGEWGYPGAMAGRTDSTIPTEVKPPEVPDNVKERIVIVPRTSTSVSEGEPVRTGDFSNTQYAILGLRACAQAHIDIPKETWKRALDYMKKFQHEDGGWGYVRQGEQDQSPYASLTCAGVCGASVCLYQLGKKNPKTDPIVSKALKWLKEHWDATQNTWADMSSVILPSTWQYYHLYSVERVGSVLGLKKLGSRKWYPEGARWVLDQQKGNGSWDDPGSDLERPNYLQTADTCFAILFLARATPSPADDISPGSSPGERPTASRRRSLRSLVDRLAISGLMSFLPRGCSRTPYGHRPGYARPSPIPCLPSARTTGSYPVVRRAWCEGVARVREGLKRARLRSLRRSWGALR